MHGSQSIQTQPLGKTHGHSASQILLGTDNILGDFYSYKHQVSIIRVIDVQHKIRLHKHRTMDIVMVHPSPHWRFAPYHKQYVGILHHILKIIIALNTNVHKHRFNMTSKVAEIRPFLYSFVAQEDTSWTAWLWRWTHCVIWNVNCLPSDTM